MLWPCVLSMVTISITSQIAPESVERKKSFLAEILGCQFLVMQCDFLTAVNISVVQGVSSALSF